MADYVKDYISRFYLHDTDCTIRLKTNEPMRELDWKVALAFTEELNMTGSRVAQATRKYLGSATHFAVTNVDGLTDAKLAEELGGHPARPRIPH